jgi:hypothetical protein
MTKEYHPSQRFAIHSGHATIALSLSTKSAPLNAYSGDFSERIRLHRDPSASFPRIAKHLSCRSLNNHPTWKTKFQEAGVPPLPEEDNDRQLTDPVDPVDRSTHPDRNLLLRA